jgi:serpin B
MKARVLPVLLFGAMLATACTGPGSAASPGSTAEQPAASFEEARADLARASVTPADARAAADAVNAFGLDLYRSLGADTENFVFSPASIALALGMARAGARGATAAQMDAVLREAASDANEAWLNALDQALAARSGSFEDAMGERHELTLRIANAAFGQRDVTFETAFLGSLARRYGAGLKLVDYVRDTEAARQQINRWVDERTEHRIDELIAAGLLSPSTVLTLVNAIYLKAPWEYPFNEADTAPAAFHLADGSSIQVPTMTMMAPFPHADGDGWRAVELPYAGDALAMTVIVPDDLAAFEAELSPELLEGIVAELGGDKVELSMPKFSTETSVSLNTALAELGMADAFEPGAADFSGMTRETRLFIAAVVHQANIDVDEKGTTAAAATAVVMELSGSAEPPIRVDRPFVFAVRDVATGAILFLGRIGDPSVGY